MYCANYIAVEPRNIAITPRQSTYRPGDRIQCSAEGNPEPSYHWTDLVSGTVVQGAVLNISEDMVNGSHTFVTFQCTASNRYNGNMYKESATVEFNVTVATRTTGCKQHTSFLSVNIYRNLNCS